MLTATPFFLVVAGLLQDEGVRESEHHGDTNADQEGRVDQTSQQEHFGLQFVHQLGLTSGCFEVFATHDADTDTSTDSAQTNDEASCECYITEDVFHFVAPKEWMSEKSEEKPKSVRLSGRHVPDPHTPASTS
jgi:hypothetical protein